MSEYTYAKKTAVPVERSKAELERLIGTMGATDYMTYSGEKGELVYFKVKGFTIRMEIPRINPERFSKTPTGRDRTTEQIQKEIQCERMRLWRALILMIKGKWEAIQEGITTLENEFLPHMMLPNQQTVREYLGPQLDTLIKTGKMPPMLPGVEDHSNN
jgi:hypothetical protein